MMLRTIAAIALLGSSAAALAVPVTYTDTVDPYPDVFLGPGNTGYSYTHDINDNGFNPSADDLLSVSLSMDLDDDGDNDHTSYRTVRVTTWCGRHSRWGRYHCHYAYRRYVSSPGQPETVTVNADGTMFGAYEVDYNPLDLDIALADLQLDGLLTIDLSVLSGDLIFRSSTLTVEADRSIAVSEPTSLALVGLGLVAMGLRRGRRSRPSGGDTK